MVVLCGEQAGSSSAGEVAGGEPIIVECAVPPRVETKPWYPTLCYVLSPFLTVGA